MILTVQNENVFTIPTNGFAVSPSTSGYTLAYSVDGTNFTEHTEETGSGDTLVVNTPVKGLAYKLVGNTDTVTIQY